MSEIIYASQGCCKGAVLNVSVFQLSKCKVGCEVMASKSLAWFLAFGPPDLLDSWLCAFVSVMRLSAMHISMMLISTMHNQTNRQTKVFYDKDVFDGPSVLLFIVLLSLFGHLGHVDDTVWEGRVRKKKRDH